MSGRNYRRGSKGRFVTKRYYIFESPELNLARKLSDGSQEPCRIARNGKSDTVGSFTGNLKLVTNNTSNKRKETTPCSGDVLVDAGSLIWPAKVTKAHQASILKVCVGIEVDVVQMLLDELEGSQKEVKNPVSYIRRILSDYLKGEFVSSGAILTAEKRSRERFAQERLDAVMKNSIKVGQEFLDRHSTASQNVKK